VPRKRGPRRFCSLHSTFCIRISRPMPFQQRTNTSCYLAIPTRGFTAAVSVFRGTPPGKPLECKSCFRHSGVLACDRWADPTGGEPRLSHALLRCVSGDIIETSSCYRSQCVILSYRVQVLIVHGQTKSPAADRQAGLWKSFIRFTCLPWVDPDTIRVFARRWIDQGGTYRLRTTDDGLSRQGQTSPANS